MAFNFATNLFVWNVVSFSFCISDFILFNLETNFCVLLFFNLQCSRWFSNIIYDLVSWKSEIGPMIVVSDVTYMKLL